MKVLDVLILIVLFAVLGFGIYVLYLSWPGGETQSGVFNYDADFNISDLGVNVSGNMQFYQNLRYRNSVITYSIDVDCNDKKRSDIERAFEVLENNTLLRFARLVGGEIEFLCSDVSPEPEEKEHFIAGEGGPSKIVQAGDYNVIYTGKVSLFREDKCESPNVALHEILHALGFEHDLDELSIMYPITECNQVLDEKIIKEINRLYSIESEADLIVSKANFTKSRLYMDFEISVLNAGFKDAGGSKLKVIIDGKTIKSFELQDISIGTTRIITVENLKIPIGFDSVIFFIESEDEEISKENNEVILPVN